ncbi:hypothetical protein LguiA_026322 [Lonicera macranthoides]
MIDHGTKIKQPEHPMINHASYQVQSWYSYDRSCFLPGSIMGLAGTATNYYF